MVPSIRRCCNSSMLLCFNNILVGGNITIFSSLSVESPTLNAAAPRVNVAPGTGFSVAEFLGVGLQILELPLELRVGLPETATGLYVLQQGQFEIGKLLGLVLEGLTVVHSVPEHGLFFEIVLKVPLLVLFL